MTFKKQIKTIKENWLLVALVLLLLIGNPMTLLGATSSPMLADMVYEGSMAKGMPTYNENFAPEIEQRKITKTTSISTEVEQGEFKTAEEQFKHIVKSSSSTLLSDNVHKYSYRSEYYQGNYQIKVDVAKYDSVISQLKEIGEVQSFNERATDITGQYENLEINLATEKARLARYREMYAEAEIVEDKIKLNDRIFNQERTIKYLEDSIANMDKRVEYSTINFNIKEKESEYANIVFVKLSELIRGFVESINMLLEFVFWILPWAAAFLIARKGWRFMKKKKYL